MKKNQRKPRVSLEAVVAKLSAEPVKGDSKKRKRIELLGAMLWHCGERFRRNRAGVISWGGSSNNIPPQRPAAREEESCLSD